MPVCSVCGQAEHKPHDGVLDHCKTCRQPIYAGTTYWIHRRAHVLTDHYYCCDCLAFNRTADELALRAAGLFRAGRSR